MATQAGEKGPWLQVRMSVEDKATLLSLATEYGLTTSMFVRLMVQYFDESRPVMQVSYGPKAGAPALEAAKAM